MTKVHHYIRRMLSPNVAGTHWLSILRIGTALMLIGKIASEWPYLHLLYASSGIVPPEIAAYSQHPYIPTIHGIYALMANSLTENVFLKCFFLLQLVFALSLLMRRLTRVSAVLCWAMMCIVFNSSHLTSYGFEAILLTLLFYCVIFPAGRHLSMDGAITPTVIDEDISLTAIFHKTIQLHICMIYFVNGISKMQGTGWQDGSGIWDAINQPQFHSWLTPLLQKLLEVQYVSAILSWAVIVTEVAYPFLIWVKPAQRPIFLMILLLHIGIAVVMGLWLFALSMIVFNLVAFGHVLRKKKLSDNSTSRTATICPAQAAVA